MEPLRMSPTQSRLSMTSMLEALPPLRTSRPSVRLPERLRLLKDWPILPPSRPKSLACRTLSGGQINPRRGEVESNILYPLPTLCITIVTALQCYNAHNISYSMCTSTLCPLVARNSRSSRAALMLPLPLPLPSLSAMGLGSAARIYRAPGCSSAHLKAANSSLAAST